MLTEIYYEVDEFNKQHLEKIAVYAATIDWYSKRQLGCMTMSEIMTILIYYHYSHYKNFKSYYEQYVSKYGAPQLLDRISVFLCLLDDA